jgi:hypothetical protein
MNGKKSFKKNEPFAMNREPVERSKPVLSMSKWVNACAQNPLAIMFLSLNRVRIGLWVRSAGIEKNP